MYLKKKKKVLLFQLLSFNSEEAKEANSLALFIKKVKNMFDGGITSILFGFEKFTVSHET